MDKQSTEQKEETLVAMLASFRKEACYHDNFEEDFLRNFHLRKETDQATQSTWKLLLERLDNYLQNFRIYASMSIVTLAAVGVIIASGDMEPADAYVSAPRIPDGKLQPVSDEEVEITSTDGAAGATTTLTTDAPSNETSIKENQLQTDSNTDDKPVSRVLIEM